MSLVDKFAEAGLTLELPANPISHTDRNRDIFQLDIERRIKGQTRQEIFRIWPGHSTNRVEVLSVDKSLGQLVLLVKEEKREMVVQIPPRHPHSREVFFTANRIKEEEVFKENGLEYVKRMTPGNKRHFLLGMDERQLFIAQLPRGVSSVKDSHACLKAPTVTFFEGKARGRTIRQGEWFFVNIAEAERISLEKGIKDGTLFLKKKEGIPGGNGKPHVADELVVVGSSHELNPRLVHGFTIRPEERFVRGSVNHPDHSVVKFREWRKAIRNTENNSGRMEGVGWVD